MDRLEERFLKKMAFALQFLDQVGLSLLLLSNHFLPGPFLSHNRILTKKEQNCQFNYINLCSLDLQDRSVDLFRSKQVQIDIKLADSRKLVDLPKVSLNIY